MGGWRGDLPHITATQGLPSGVWELSCCYAEGRGFDSPLWWRPRAM